MEHQSTITNTNKTTGEGQGKFSLSKVICEKRKLATPQVVSHPKELQKLCAVSTQPMHSEYSEFSHLANEQMHSGSWVS